MLFIYAALLSISVQATDTVSTNDTGIFYPEFGYTEIPKHFPDTVKGFFNSAAYEAVIFDKKGKAHIKITIDNILRAEGFYDSGVSVTRKSYAVYEPIDSKERIYSQLYYIPLKEGCWYYYHYNPRLLE